MKKLVAFLTVAGMLSFGVSNYVAAQSDTTKAATTTQVSQTTPEVAPEAAPESNRSFHQMLKSKFIEGGAGWMSPILLCLIVGLALVVERIIYLNLSSTNTTKLLNKVETALESQGVEAAKEICRNTRGPVASIFYQGLDRYNEGIEIVEKSVVSYGGVLMARLNNNLGWITLFIALAPMLGFLGTVVGMVAAFDSIEAAGDISPTVVAGGMKVALLTTVFGLIVAIILQVFYNYLISKVDGIVNSMEDATITFMDILVRNKNAKK
ncbi:MAG TPA: flagellar motor protein MotA [Bacteroidales bacterium]|nr:MAG: flagellar motor protein MotA [Bacteroidetes bacterium GWE2_42_24]OFY25981.1 MAG: flagellar motor protein MotA [Bacteroidetes bacterium GWF2_43_11]PKP23601.1 MAG: flagellar motor protein MotA [Bacteroidetes bacterium HGW-Bacteroidetes-22]HBZ66607.1 flagellar motor protein MotA [Bacteroidales bacterium]